MNDPQNINCFTRYAKDGPIVPIQKMAVSCPQYFIFRNERTSFGKVFQCFNLIFQLEKEFL